MTSKGRPNSKGTTPILKKYSTKLSTTAHILKNKSEIKINLLTIYMIPSSSIILEKHRKNSNPSPMYLWMVLLMFHPGHTL